MSRTVRKRTGFNEEAIVVLVTTIAPVPERVTVCRPPEALSTNTHGPAPRSGLRWNKSDRDRASRAHAEA